MEFVALPRTVTDPLGAAWARIGAIAASIHLAKIGVALHGTRRPDRTGRRPDVRVAPRPLTT